MNGCTRTDRRYVCRLDTPEDQRECSHYDRPQDGEPYCRHNREFDGSVGDQCRSSDAHREADKAAPKPFSRVSVIGTLP